MKKAPSQGLLRSVSNVDLGALAQREYKDDGADAPPPMQRELTKLEREVLARKESADALIKDLKERSDADDPTQIYMPSMLKGALFCGHLVTDM
eukprot:CAMPEP_0172608036 /NCGR_PEP_ID=MMETSP1068-20121228/28152_1 /TAXON_ID=35684 /ORGANISM="Pseudopedinella elastica, Strain CCMP716" /LENGTH=93 /DNA_ID=CAMNT_0013411185 /DNA_START=28 /DNA_END=306 /DNA_ORIENTATION=+